MANSGSNNQQLTAADLAKGWVPERIEARVEVEVPKFVSEQVMVSESAKKMRRACKVGSQTAETDNPMCIATTMSVETLCRRTI